MIVVRRIAVSILLLALVLGSAVPVFAAPTDHVIVRDADLSQFPQVRLQVTVPAELASAGRPVFSASENGRKVDVVEASVKSQQQAIDAVLVVDTSGSMKGAAMEAAKTAAKAFITELKAPSRVALVAFSDKPAVLVPTTDDAAILGQAIDRMQPKGETSLYDAVLLALNQVKRADGVQPAVIVLSDGADTTSRVSLTQAVSAVRSAGVPVLVVALPSAEADHAPLKLLAEQSGGRLATIADLGALTAYYRGLAKELQTSYSLIYHSNRPSTVDLEIGVTAKSGGRTATGDMVVQNPMAIYEQPTVNTLRPVAPANLFTYAVAVTMVFISVAMFVVSGALMLIRPSTGLNQLAYYDQTGTDAADTGASQERVLSGVVAAVDYVAGKRGFKRLAYEELDRAGLPLRPAEYITLHMLIVIVTGIAAGMASQSIAVSLLVVILATVAPIAWIGMRIRKRRDAFESQLPDTLDLIAGSLRAGWGLQQAIEAVVEQAKPPISEEFRRAQTEVRLGRLSEQALESVAARMQSVDFNWVVSAISIQREVGGNLAELLNIVSSTIRERNALKRQVATLTSEGRLSAVILFVLPFLEAGILFIINRGYISQLFVTSTGLVMLITGILLLIVGGVWLNRVIRVEV